MSSEKTPEETFLEKHKPKTPQDIYKIQKDSEDARKKYTKDVEEIERNLMSYLSTEDPIVDPGTGKVIAWMRHVPYAELLTYTPQNISREDIIKSRNDPSILIDKAMESEGEDFIFVLMERLISKPSHDAPWWKEHADMAFIELFNARMAEVYFRLGEQISFF